MTDLDAGRELDERVARLVYGTPQTNPDWWSRHLIPTQVRYRLPRVSGNREAAMTLLDTLAERGWMWSVGFSDWDTHGPYEARLWREHRPGTRPRSFLHRDEATGRQIENVTTYALTLPLAVCRAVVAALSPQEAP
jgi:hypothetical protein